MIVPVPPQIGQVAPMRPLPLHSGQMFSPARRSRFGLIAGISFGWSEAGWSLGVLVMVRLA